MGCSASACSERFIIRFWRNYIERMGAIKVKRKRAEIQSKKNMGMFFGKEWMPTSNLSKEYVHSQRGTLSAYSCSSFL